MIKISRGRKEKPEYLPFPGSKEEALAYERERRGITDSSDPGFTDMLPEFVLAYRNRSSENGLKSLQYSLRHLTAFFGGFKLRHLAASTLIEQYKSSRLADGVKKRTINIELSALSAYLSWMNETRGTAYPRPKRFGKRETAPPMPMVLTPHEIAAILLQLEGEVRTMVELMVLAGMRRNEVLHLKATDVDLGAGGIRVHGKGGKWRMVPVSSGQTLEELKRLCALRPTGPLFVSTRTGRERVDIRKRLWAAAERAGISKHVHPHLFRHSFATALVNGGVDISTVQKLLGHGDVATTQVYTQIADATKRQATDSLSVAIVAIQKSLNNQQVE